MCTINCDLKGWCVTTDHMLNSGIILIFISIQNNQEKWLSKRKRKRTSPESFTFLRDLIKTIESTKPLIRSLLSQLQSIRSTDSTST